MQKRKCAGRRFLLWGALILLVWAGYEFIVRAETIWWAVKGVYDLCVGEGIAFTRAIRYFDGKMFELMGFLLACVLLAILCICLRNRPHAAWLLMPASILIGWYDMNGLEWPTGNPADWFVSLNVLGQLQLLKLIPILLILIGCVANLCQTMARPAPKHKSKSHRAEYAQDDADFDDYDDPASRRRREAALRRRRKGRQVI